MLNLRKKTDGTIFSRSTVKKNITVSIVLKHCRHLPGAALPPSAVSYFQATVQSLSASSRWVIGVRLQPFRVCIFMRCLTFSRSKKPSMHMRRWEVLCLPPPFPDFHTGQLGSFQFEGDSEHVNPFTIPLYNLLYQSCCMCKIFIDGRAKDFMICSPPPSRGGTKTLKNETMLQK